MKHIKRISIEDAERLHGQDEVLFLDIRDPQSYRCGNISGSINVGDHNLKTLIKQLNKTLTIIVYCYHGISSLEMTQLLTDFGFENSYSMDGGYEGWVLTSVRGGNMRDETQVWLRQNDFDHENLEKKAYNGETALMYAARTGQTDFLTELIDFGADIESKNNDGNTAVWLACYSGNPHTLNILIEEDADLDCQNDNGASALIYAASAGLYEMVEALIEAGANPNLTTLDGFSALDVASTLPILRMLRRYQETFNQHRKTYFQQAAAN